MTQEQAAGVTGSPEQHEDDEDRRDRMAGGQAGEDARQHEDDQDRRPVR